MGFAPGRSNNAPRSAPPGPRESLVFLLKRRERSRVAAERIGGGCIPVLFIRQGLCGLTRNSRRLPTLLLHGLSPIVLSRGGPQNMRQPIRTYPFLVALSRARSRVFTFSTKSPLALCQFITFANQMMSLDILRRGFIVGFYAGRTASVKRNSCRAFTTHRLSRAEIRSPSRSRSIDGKLRGPRLLTAIR